MLKWGKGKDSRIGKQRNFCAQQGGHNATPALAEYGIAKRIMEGEVTEGEVTEGEVTEGEYNPLREMTILDYILCTLGLAFFATVLYFGVGYYYDTYNVHDAFRFGGANYYGR